ncbi:hypothetical protein GSI_03468 [Ganoderma sinense ZZ0214-1]|uniref:Uncharacterized protein n=1 Tax=Ganoderma sinense ZZ0214-1 TaxID=1077348 RepID=A0A2G8SM83_9APHY|nr:hypothetical protein GSI_03468 [Ganoderma sinense ZZ0214-1]
MPKNHHHCLNETRTPVHGIKAQGTEVIQTVVCLRHRWAWGLGILVIRWLSNCPDHGYWGVLPFQREVLNGGEGGEQPHPGVEIAHTVVLAADVKTVHRSPGEDGGELVKSILEVERPRGEIAGVEPQRNAWSSVGPPYVPCQFAAGMPAFDFAKRNHLKDGEAAGILGKEGEESICDVYRGVGDVTNNPDVGVGW